ncbi:MAG: hypothetical protein M1814_004888 [Vezdaea aestivalis]|nr:MAG: hypothetical protein M1814_004888 [Vezdaea aestivalis]
METRQPSNSISTIATTAQLSAQRSITINTSARPPPNPSERSAPPRTHSPQSARPSRVTPAWVRSPTPPTDTISTSPPSSPLAPDTKPNTKRARPTGRKHDQARSASPVIGRSNTASTMIQWRSFARSTAEPQPEPSTDLGQAWLDSLPASAGYGYDWLEGPKRWAELGALDEEAAAGARGRVGTGEEGGVGGMYGEKRPWNWRGPRTERKAWYVRAQNTLLRNPFVPLMLRLVILAFSLAALVLAVKIYRNGGKPGNGGEFGRKQQPSTILALIVSSIALVFVFFVTYDEYSSKPLGLRSPKAKMRLIFLDLFFIVFSSANLSLAFDTINDAYEACRGGSGWEEPLRTQVCRAQRGLAAVLLIVLVSVFRVVERVTR